MSSSLGRLTPRVFSPGRNLFRSYHPRLFFRGQNAPTRVLRRENISALNSITALSKTQLRSQSTIILDTTEDTAEASRPPEPAKVVLPTCCPGCGAYTQTVEPNEAGYYGKTRKQTRKLRSDAKNDPSEESKTQEAAAVIQQVVDDGEIAPGRGQRARVENATNTVSQYLGKSQQPVPYCDRCHDLLHHNKAVSAVSPTIQSIEAYLDESPHRHNRIYHVIDAADFPMSIIDGIYEELPIQEQRSRNRRSATKTYKHGRQLPTISFVITRSDLLGPTKEAVDSKMEFVRTVLREKLNLSSEDFRMGNVHMISAHRGWWTKNVKEEMREHGGGLWIVGKANAGKSNFVQACLPKDSKNLEKMTELIARRDADALSLPPQEESYQDSDRLLPPAPREDLYPVLPVVSSLPGTTVSPIRIPFGRGKGEIIDLPGLDRGNLADYVVEEHKRDLIMTDRGKPARYSVSPGQSLLVGGGLVRITPLDPEVVTMAACFLPIETHVTRTDKAVEMQAESRSYPKTKYVKDGTGKVISSAGTFDLKWDVTRSHLPKALAKAVEDRGVKPPPLPYRVMSADILVEGCGWVELAAQIRAKRGDEDDKSFPQVEVFTPHGKHVASRRPIECYEFEAKRLEAKKRGARKRPSVSHMKRVERSRK